MNFIDKNQEKTKEMEKYEKETGKSAIWRGNITESFKKWQKGQKINDQEKERVTILVSEKKKEKWLNHIKEYDYPSLSKLIREAVEYFIDIRFKAPSFTKSISKITHALKEPLTLIKGFSQLIIENYKDKADWDLLEKIKDIFDQSKILEKIINSISEDFKQENQHYSILIVDDDNNTIKVLEGFFEIKKYSFKILTQGWDVIEELEKYQPKLILLDIILPDISGFEICKMIKSNPKFKNIPVFYITAISVDEVENKLPETKANGYFLKPFDFKKLEILFDYL